jgi:putative spermidine/putrescine transport system permease protein
MPSCTSPVRSTNVYMLPMTASTRYRFRLRTAVQLVTIPPMFVPMVMTGLAILIYTKQPGWESEAGRLFVGHAIMTLPYVVRTVMASLAGFDPNQELATRNLGASPMRAFMLIALPQLGPRIFAGAIFAFIVSFDNVGLSIFLTGSQFNTLPVELYSYASYNNDPTSAAVSVLMILFSVVTIAALEYFFSLQKIMAGRTAAPAAG